jgi:hypothetical protein
MKNVDLGVCFKGTRQYVHGTDMLNKSAALLIQELGTSLEQLDFVIHSMTDRSLCLNLDPTEYAVEFQASDVAELKFLAGGHAWVARLSEMHGTPACRYPYDEDVVGARCSLDVQEREIVLSDDAPYSKIETLVAMTKSLHQAKFPGTVGSWVFCRWSSPVWPIAQNLNGVRIQLAQVLGTRLTRSVVSLNGQTLGDIYFSARPSK